VTDAAPPIRVYDEVDFFSADLAPEAGAGENAVPPLAPGRRGRVGRAVARRALSMVCGAVLGLGAVLGVRALGGVVFASHPARGQRVHLNGGTGVGARTGARVSRNAYAAARVVRHGGSRVLRSGSARSCAEIGCRPRTGVVAPMSDQAAAEPPPVAPAEGEFGFEP
jgi:hypothetical protein